MASSRFAIAQRDAVDTLIGRLVEQHIPSWGDEVRNRVARLFVDLWYEATMLFSVRLLITIADDIQLAAGG